MLNLSCDGDHLGFLIDILNGYRTIHWSIKYSKLHEIAEDSTEHSATYFDPNMVKKYGVTVLWED